MKVAINLDGTETMLCKRGLGSGGYVQKLLASECARHMDPYVPFQQGFLKNDSREIGIDYVKYNAPYARMMYYGKVMVDPATNAAGFLTPAGWRSHPGVKKVPSGRVFKYHGAPVRGPFWDKRMWQDKKSIILKTLAKAAGGRIK